MKTLAVIKNELFKDFLKIVSTDNLEKTLDNPEVPLPYTCLDSVSNDNSDLLAAQLATYFQRSKVSNKDFYVLDEDATAQLSFMLNLIKLSSGQSNSLSQVQSTQSNGQVNLNNELNKENISEKKTHEVAQPVQVNAESSTEKLTDSNSNSNVNSTINVTTTPSNLNSTGNTNVESFVTEVKPEVKIESKPEPVKTFQKPSFGKPSIGKPSVKPGVPQPIAEPEWNEEDDPFSAELEQIRSQANVSSTLNDPNAFDPFKEIPVDEMDDDEEISEQNTQENVVPHQDIATTDEVNPFAPEEKVELSEQHEEETASENVTHELGDIVSEFGIAKHSILHFSKDESITATLVDDKSVEFEGQILGFTEAAKAAFKKAGSFGMATGLGNWVYEGQTLKTLKEQKA